MLHREVKYSYNDVAIVPYQVSNIEHRNECNPFTFDNMLPLFTAPMDTVVNEENFGKFENNKITPILPRNFSLNKRMEYSLNGKWAAFSLKEFEENFASKKHNSTCIKVLIDVANGHMKKIYDLVKKSKELYDSSIIIMVGNIANPRTYWDVFESGADYVRLGIGSGLGCITTSNVAIHYPMASLIAETYELKKVLSNRHGVPMEKMPKIIADGGIRNYSDVIKAIALGADYVMVGGLFASFLESASPILKTLGSGWDSEMEGHLDEIEIHGGKTYFRGKEKRPLEKVFYGMASKKGQESINGKANKTAEGIVKTIDVKYNMASWCENMADYLRSAMSYCDSKTLGEFKDKSEVNIISNNTYYSVNK